MMVTEVSRYLARIRHDLKLEPGAEKAILDELESHIEDQCQELIRSGQTEEEAARNSLWKLGSSSILGQQLYEAHHQGSWRQSLMAAVPHLLFALTFILNWWQGPGTLLIMLFLVIGAAIYGWARGRPNWLFPWLGYGLLPVIAAGIFLLSLPLGWSWLAIVFYIPLALWLVISIDFQVIKRDWLYITLMFIPVPAVISWAVIIWPEAQVYSLALDSIRSYAPWIGLSFLTLGLSAMMFIRLRKRILKVGILFVAGLVTLLIAAGFTQGRLGIVAFALLFLMMLGLFLIPALLERGVRKESNK